MAIISLSAQIVPLFLICPSVPLFYTPILFAKLLYFPEQYNCILSQLTTFASPPITLLRKIKDSTGDPPLLQDGWGGDGE